MADDLNIVIIGAGSASFGLENLTGIMANEKLKERTTLSLVDVDIKNLKAITSLATNINKEWKSEMKIVSTSNRSDVLSDADFIILSVAVNREETWFQDYKIGIKYGLWHYAENGGPGSFSQTARNLAFIMPILYDIHDLSPNAWLINYTNPVPRIGYAAEYADVKCIGLCHQLWEGYSILGRYLANDLGITENLDYTFKWDDENAIIQAKFAIEAVREYEITAIGLNHFTWMTDVRRRGSWENMYPLIQKEASNLPSQFEPLTQHVFKIFGLLPVPGDTHLAEFLPYTYKKTNWEKYSIQLYDFDRAKRQREEMWKKINSIITGTHPMDLFPNPNERSDAVISEIFTNANAYEAAVNIKNDGSISNLPTDAIVEIPAILNNRGAIGLKNGKLPEGIAALCQKEISVAKLITKSSIEGDRDLALQAFALMIDDLDLAQKLLTEYLQTYKKYLSHFF